MVKWSKTMRLAWSSETCPEFMIRLIYKTWYITVGRPGEKCKLSWEYIIKIARAHHEPFWLISIYFCTKKTSHLSKWQQKCPSKMQNFPEIRSPYAPFFPGMTVGWVQPESESSPYQITICTFKVINCNQTFKGWWKITVEVFLAQ